MNDTFFLTSLKIKYVIWKCQNFLLVLNVFIIFLRVRYFCFLTFTTHPGSCEYIYWEQVQKYRNAHLRFKLFVRVPQPKLVKFNNTCTYKKKMQIEGKFKNKFGRWLMDTCTFNGVNVTKINQRKFWSYTKLTLSQNGKYLAFSNAFFIRRKILLLKLKTACIQEDYPLFNPFHKKIE